VRCNLRVGGRGGYESLHNEYADQIRRKRYFIHIWPVMSR